MRQETNNEMDLLLRRLGRRQDGSVPAPGDHLDADELNSYAENALPAAARTRYTEHLAECSRCRELVVQLSSSAGVVHVGESANLLQPSVLRKFLASIFSPMVLRYAVPALGLIIVAVIGLIVVRRDQMGEMVTQVREDTPSASSVAAPQPSPDDQSKSGFNDQSKATPSSEHNRTKGKAESDQSAPGRPNNAPAVTSTTDLSKETPAQKVEQAAANEPPPKPAPTPASVAVQGKREESESEVRKREVQELTAVQPASGDLRRQDRPPAEFGAGRAARTEKNKTLGSSDSAAPKGAESAAKIQRDGEKADKDEYSETRSVAGRQFRRQRGIWIDTAYDSSRSTVNLSRGSEQYRALVADEPAIKTIADQLGGEIVVVWKGRAYRIR